MSTVAERPFTPPRSSAARNVPTFVSSLDELITQDDTPVDNKLIEKLMRLWARSLYVSWKPPDDTPFCVMSNVGLFFEPRNPAIVPDLMLVTGIAPPEDPKSKEERSYFVWLTGKVPDLVLEAVSDRRGGEDTTKKDEYARRGVRFYVIYDPDDHLRGGELRAFELVDGIYVPIDARWIPGLNLGLTFWEGEFERSRTKWLRWCDQDGHILPTGEESAEIERRKAEAERKAADAERKKAESAQKVADTERKKANAERKAANAERKKAEAAQRAADVERKKAEMLREKLRSLGIEPDE